MFTSSLNFNRRAERWAEVNNKPLVGNCDVHRLRQLGSTYSLVEAEPDPEAICAAIRAGRVANKKQTARMGRGGLHSELGRRWRCVFKETCCAKQAGPQGRQGLGIAHVVVVNQPAIQQLIEQLADLCVLRVFEIPLQAFYIFKFDRGGVGIILGHQRLIRATVRDAHADLKSFD